MLVKNEILKDLNNFKSLCQAHNVKYLYAFGSSTTDAFDLKTQSAVERQLGIIREAVNKFDTIIPKFSLKIQGK